MKATNITILFRPSLADEGEYAIAQSVCPQVITRRADIPEHSLVVGRYSVLPYYKECSDDCDAMHSRLINSPAQHDWIASFSYYYDITEHTFPTWFQHEYPYSTYDGPVVIKGRTNSMKMKWNTHMFAESRSAVPAVVSRLYENPMLETQGLIYRQYIPLTQLETGLHGLPITEEYRLFFYKKTFLAGGFYWANLASQSVVDAHVSIPDDAMGIGNMVAAIACEYTNFFVVDVARTQEGKWICVEINDGQMSGLSATDPTTLYINLIKAIDNDLSLPR